MKRRYGAVSLALVLSALVAVLAALVVVQESDAITFEPTLAASLSDDTAGAAADLTTQFGIPAGSAQFFAQATFTPPEFQQTAGADIPIGAMVGQLNANATLGLINGPCNSALPVAFDMMNGTTDTSATVTFDDQFQDADANTLPDGVDKYPDFLTRMFPGLTPVFRQFGQASVAGSPVSLNFVVFEPGSTLPTLGALDPAWGYPSVSVLNNNGDPGAVAAPNPITDFCTPLSTNVTTFGTAKDNPDTSADESGTTIQMNPADGGTYTFRSRSISQYDADDDNIENGLDTCPYDPNVGDYTVAGSGDQDTDGLDDACDPTPTETKVDEDDDGYTNRGDNCPLVANGADPDNQADRDTDSIGDACDQNPDTPDGGTASPVDVTVTADVVISGGAPAASPTTAPASPTTAAASPTAAATGTAVATATATKTATVVPTTTPAPTPQPAEVGGGGLLSDEEGFPTWGFVLIALAAVLLLGGLGTAVTVRRRSK
jgi:hypothetical protein